MPEIKRVLMLICLTGGWILAAVSLAAAAEDVSLDQKIGQMIITGFRGYRIEPDSAIARNLRQNHLGGVVLYDYDVQTHKFERNIQNPDQLKQLITQVKSLADPGLLVALDYEGGKVCRLQTAYGFPATLSAAEVARLPESESEQAFLNMAKTLAGLGINLNLAPVVDLNLQPDSPAIGAKQRSYSADPAVVAKLARLFITSHHRYGILTALKHFPGHGSALADSHLGFTDVTRTWQKQELDPYRSLVKSGDADAVMTAHIFHSGLDETYPATLSPKVIGGLLRREIGFQGVVISDDLQMGAIQKAAYNGQVLDLQEVIRLALEAGCDMLMFANNTEYDEQIVEKAARAVKRLLAEGKITEARIDQSYRRILQFKRRGLANPKRAPEFRGFYLEPASWVSPGSDTGTSRLERLLGQAAGQHFNAAILPAAYFKDEARGMGALESAHRQGLQVYAACDLASLAQPEAQAGLRSVVRDLAARYPLDGIIFQNAAYPSARGSHDPANFARFYGQSNLGLRDWADWRREQLTQLLTVLYAEIKSAKPDLAVACRVNGIYDKYFSDRRHDVADGYHDALQDSLAWLAGGRTDFLLLDFSAVQDQELVRETLAQAYAEADKNRMCVLLDPRFGAEAAQVEWIRGHGFQGSVREKGAAGRGQLFPEACPPAKGFRNAGVSQTGIVLGAVLDGKRQPLSDAWVSLRGPRPESKGDSKPAEFTCASGSDGRFAFVHLSPGVYMLSAYYYGLSQTAGELEVRGEQALAQDLVIAAAEAGRKQVFVQVFSPADGAETTEASVHLYGRTLPGQQVWVESAPTTVYATGAFACDNIPLVPGPNRILVTAADAQGNSTTRAVHILRRAAPVPETPREFEISQPARNLALLPGDVLEVEITGPPGWDARVLVGGRWLVVLTEQPVQGQPAAKYSASVKIPPGFITPPQPLRFLLADKQGFLFFRRSREILSSARFEVWDPESIRVAETVSEKTAMHIGTHDVRLRGPYVSEVPPGTRLELIGKQGKQYKIRLSASMSAWVDETDLRLLPGGSGRPHAFFTQCLIAGDEEVDRILIPLDTDVAFAITPETFPAPCLQIDLFNTHLATTWFMHRSTASVLGQACGRQMEDDWCRLTVPLAGKQLWGYGVERDYEEKDQKYRLAIWVKRPPLIGKTPATRFSHLAVALEPGHGGSDTGAIGIMGTKEKEVNQFLAGRVKAGLEKKGARVILLSPGDCKPSFPEKLRRARAERADLLLSLHANWGSWEKGIMTYSGCGVFYKHANSRPLAEAIDREMLALGWQDYGVVGNFNAALVREAGMPAALIEQGFLTHPSDEARLLDPAFQQRQADAIVRGVEKFIASQAGRDDERRRDE